MFIKWVKGLIAEWWDEYSDVVLTMWLIFALISWCIFIVVLLNPNPIKTDVGKFVENTLFPIGLIAGVIPTAFYCSFKVGIRLFGLYLDYKYFVANGGKRKRSSEYDDYDPYRKDEQP